MRYVVVLCLGWIACQTQPGQEASVPPLSPEEQQQQMQDSLFDEMMAIHDSVMPEMDHIYQLRQQIRAELDSLVATNQSNAGARIDALEQAYLNLAEADEAMMQWMRENDFAFEGMTHEEIMTLMEREKQDIRQVADQMRSSIREAETLLAE